MKQRLRELGCVLLGHDWFLYGVPSKVTKQTPLTHKACRRCYRNELNL